MLPGALPSARIMRFGYRSAWFGPANVATKKTLVQDVAQMLLKGLENCRDASQPKSLGTLPLLTRIFKDPARPLLFVAHSFGGHVLMYALRRSFENPNNWSNPFASTAGIAFLGTPFRGRRGMLLNDMVRTIKEAHPDYQVWPESMELSVPENPFLTENVKRFLEARVRKALIPISCFYEDSPSPIGKVLQSNYPLEAEKRVSLMRRNSA